MSKSLGLDRRDIEKAVRQYYADYEPDLYRQFDFENFELYMDGQKKGYIGVDYLVRERGADHPANNNQDGDTDADQSTGDRVRKLTQGQYSHFFSGFEALQQYVLELMESEYQKGVDDGYNGLYGKDELEYTVAQAVAPKTRCLHDGQPHATKDCPCKDKS